MAQAADRLFLDLTDTLAREIEFLADLLKVSECSRPESEVQPDDLRFTLAQGVERPLDLRLSDSFISSLSGAGCRSS